jgi:hypothetical protein
MPNRKHWRTLLTIPLFVVVFFANAAYDTAVAFGNLLRLRK